ncbi:hypothetical protein KL911_000247 [Ogataea haglerorum]|uniref:uncharacterized protein n=1 Tax=Ogataea haglerorum TaxID=1937702 RepID=UPI001C8A3C42|nr:uncharacterized protein KL911_000247 [Ogataea haglerorum]KAG7759110.1 hypothetical protein KL911_000247 [Ogataea haglerorum]
MFPLVNPPNRVLQVDAKLLDNEIFDILSRQLNEAISNPKLPRFFQILNSRYADELRLALELFVFKVTVWNKNSSYGLLLQNLVMSDGGDRRRNTKSELSRLKKTALLSFLILSYLYKKLESHLYSLDEDDEEDRTKLHQFLHKIMAKLQRLLPALQKWYAGLSLANFLAFLVHGQYPSLINRVLRIRYKPLVSTQVSFASNPETISYEFQDRQLVWNTLTEFLVFIMPMLSMSKLSKSVMRLLQTDQRLEEKETIYRFLPERCCAICYQNTTRAGETDASIDEHLITNPFETSCGHVYCYVCLMAKLEDGDPWQCLRCGERVEFVRVFDGEPADYEPDSSDQESASEYSSDSGNESDSSKSFSDKVDHVYN